MTIDFLDLGAQYLEIAGDIDEAILSAVRSSQFVGGPLVTAFEHSFAEYIGTDHCVGVGNGTDALEIALEALEISSGAEVIVPANSFIASSEAVSRSGLKVVFCDVDPVTGLLTPETVAPVISEQTAAVIVVHLYGRPCDMTAIMELAANKGLRVIEDCAQAHGAAHQGQRVGTFGDAATFSFYPGKNLGAYGDGGAILTNDSDLAARCRMIANHGRVTKYEHEFEGRNSRLDALQAAVLSVKLGYLDRWRARRDQVAEIYLRELMSCPGIEIAPPVSSSDVHAWHLFPLQTDHRDALQVALSRVGIRTGMHYPISLPNLEAYRSVKANTPVADSIGPRVLSLPIGEHLDARDAQYVASSVVSFFVRPQ